MLSGQRGGGLGGANSHWEKVFGWKCPVGKGVCGECIQGSWTPLFSKHIVLPYSVITLPILPNGT